VVTRIGAALVVAVLLCGFPMYGHADTLVNQADTWNYTVLTFDLYPPNQYQQQVWDSVGYGSFDWGSATWTDGQAAFGNDVLGGYQYNTYWHEDTDLALMKTIIINGIITGDATLNVESDNGFVIFINGTQVAKDNAEGYPQYWWEYSYSVDPSVFRNGSNVIQAFAEDHGGGTFFDMKLTGNVTSVPEPGTIVLVGLGLVGLARVRRRIEE
jgi:hypothetical protein